MLATKELIPPIIGGCHLDVPVELSCHTVEAVRRIEVELSTSTSLLQNLVPKMTN